MQTRILRKKQIKEAAEILKNGGLVAFPTETVYGLGANALDSTAVGRVYKAKGRPADNPMIVHISDKKDLGKITKRAPDKAKKLIDRFWPGPLTLILEKKDVIPSEVTCGLKTVAVRLPKNKTAQKLIQTCGFPIAAPSANKSGGPSPTKATHVLDDLDGRIDAVIDGGNTVHGLESTVVDMTTDPPTLLRPGAVTLEQIRRIIGEIDSNEKDHAKAPKSPGMKYRHYSPKARVILSERKMLSEKVRELKAGKKNVGLMAKTKAGNPDTFIQIGRTKVEIAKNLYGNLRLFDSKKVDVIVVEEIDEAGRGHAIMNRLRRAAQ